MSQYTFKDLVEKDIDEVMDLYVDCFKDDHYFTESYEKKGIVGRDSIAWTMRTELRPLIHMILAKGRSCGVYSCNQLIGFILCFDYWAAVRNEPSLYDEIFSETPYAKVIRSRLQIRYLEKPVLYQLAIAVRKDFRRQGLASALLDTVMSDNSGWILASDVSNMQSMPIYQTRGFDISYLADEIMLVIGAC